MAIYYPSQAAVLQRADELDMDPISVFAYTAVRGRVPTNRTELEQFIGQCMAWMANYSLDWTLYSVYLFGFAQANGRLPQTLQQGYDWLAAKGFWDPRTNLVTGRVPAAGEDYPPGGLVDPGVQPCPSGQTRNAAGICVTTGGGGTLPPPVGGGFDLSAIFNWVKAHPLQTAAIGAGVFLLTGKRR